MSYWMLTGYIVMTTNYGASIAPIIQQYPTHKSCKDAVKIFEASTAKQNNKAAVLACQQINLASK